jgi:hypothetical protein
LTARGIKTVIKTGYSSVGRSGWTAGLKKLKEMLTKFESILEMMGQTRKRPPTEAALLRFRGESAHESVAVPKLNVVAVNELFDRFNGGGIVRVIVQKFRSNGIERRVDTDDVGAIVRHGAAPFD